MITVSGGCHVAWMGLGRTRWAWQRDERERSAFCCLEGEEVLGWEQRRGRGRGYGCGRSERDTRNRAGGSQASEVKPRADHLSLSVSLPLLLLCLRRCHSRSCGARCGGVGALQGRAVYSSEVHQWRGRTSGGMRASECCEITRYGHERDIDLVPNRSGHGQLVRRQVRSVLLFVFVFSLIPASLWRCVHAERLHPG